MTAQTGFTQVETVVRDALDAVAILQIPDICNQTGLPFFEVVEVLKRLTEKGIVEKVQVDRWYYWRLNRVNGRTHTNG